MLCLRPSVYRLQPHLLLVRDPFELCDADSVEDFENLTARKH
jgi:hypothetical protein